MESRVPSAPGEAVRGRSVRAAVTDQGRRVAPGRALGTSLWPAAALVAFLAVGSLAARQGSPSSGDTSAGTVPDPSQITPAQARELAEAVNRQKPAEPPAEPAPEPAEPSAPRAASAVELLLSGRMPTEVSTDLQQFGYDVFARSVSTFAPVTNVPVGPDYVIGPGDGFTVTLWGRVDAQFTLQVDRNGQVVLPEVGALRVWGMRFADLESYLQRELSRKYTDFKMSISMDRLRTITIYVVGEAGAPGSYTVSSLSTVISGLFAAGGPSKNGTLRNITLRRAGTEPVSIDLYDFLLGGDKSGDVRLQDGDTIFIPLIGPVVAVAGNVKRPAIYEMAQPMTLEEALELAGGVTFAGWLQRVQVERVEDHERRIVADFDLSEDSDSVAAPGSLATVIRDGDLVKVLSVAGTEQNVVRLAGHVIRPGKYEFRPGMKLSDLLDYDAFPPQVNLEYAEIERLIPPDLHPVTIPFNLGRLLDGDASADIELARFDAIRLFRWDEKGKRSVSVDGQVYQPGEYRLIEGMRIKDLIETGGGLQKDAYPARAELTRRRLDPNGVYYTERISVNLGKAVAGEDAYNLVLQDRDRLSVLPIPVLGFDERFVTVSGMVHDPNQYRLFEGMRVGDLLNLAGGLQKNAYLRTAEITRRHISQSGMTTEKIEIDLAAALAGDPEQNVLLHDYDYLVVRPIPDLEFDLSAEIAGQVRFPGTYPIRRGERLSSLIERAGGFTERAYLRGAVFTRQSAREVQRRRLDEMVRQVEESVLTTTEETLSGGADAETVQGQQASLQAKKELLARLQGAEITGRVVIKLAPLEEFRGSKYDLDLEDGDALTVPETPSVVYVVGEVFNPTSLLYEEGGTVNHYLRKVGGLTKEADGKQLSVIKADGSVVSKQQGSAGQLIFWDNEHRQWIFGGFTSLRLEPGDTIVAPRKLDRHLWLRTTKDITQIVFQIAVAAGVVFAI